MSLKKISGFKIEETKISRLNKKEYDLEIRCSLIYVDDNGVETPYSNKAIVNYEMLEHKDKISEAVFSELFKEISFKIFDKLT